MPLVPHGCQYMRLRGTKVHSYSKLAYAIEKEANKPAIPTKDGPKWRFLFGSEGAAAYPVAIVGSKSDILASLKDSRMVRFTVQDEVMADDPWDAIDDLGWPEDTKNMTAGMTIHVKAEFLEERKTLEIHDARIDAMKNVVTGVATMGLIPTGPVQTLVGGVRDAVGIGVTQKELTGGSGRSGKGQLALLVSMLDLGGSLDTGRRSIAARTLRHKAKEAFARLGV